MPLRIQCPRCRREFRVPDETVGKTARCQSCSQVFRIPRPAKPAPAIPAAIPIASPQSPAPAPIPAAIPIVPPQPSAPPSLAATPIANSLEYLLAQERNAAALPAAAQPIRPARSPMPHAASRRAKRRSPVSDNLEAFAWLVPIGQFLIALPLVCVVTSFAFTATYDSPENLTGMLFCTGFCDFMFLAGVFNWTWFFHLGKLGRMTRRYGPGITRIWCLTLGGVMMLFILGGSWDDRPLDQRLWPVNGPTIETPEPSEPHPPLQMPRSYPQETWAPP